MCWASVGAYAARACQQFLDAGHLCFRQSHRKQVLSSYNSVAYAQKIHTKQHTIGARLQSIRTCSVHQRAHTHTHTHTHKVRKIRFTCEGSLIEWRTSKRVLTCSGLLDRFEYVGRPFSSSTYRHCSSSVGWYLYAIRICQQRS